MTKPPNTRQKIISTSPIRRLLQERKKTEKNRTKDGDRNAEGPRMEQKKEGEVVKGSQRLTPPSRGGTFYEMAASAISQRTASKDINAERRRASRLSGVSPVKRE